MKSTTSCTRRRYRDGRQSMMMNNPLQHDEEAKNYNISKRQRFSRLTTRTTTTTRQLGFISSLVMILLCLLPSLSYAFEGGDCVLQLSRADENEDGLLSPREFVQFVHILEESVVSDDDDSSIKQLPWPLQQTFQTLANKQDMIVVYGIGKLQKLTKKEIQDELKPVCDATKETLNLLALAPDESLWSRTFPPTPAPKRAKIHESPPLLARQAADTTSSLSPTVSPRSCYLFLAMSDVDSDDELNTTEFVSFLGRMSGGGEYDDELDEFLFDELVQASESTSTNINITGAGFGVTPSTDQSIILDTICSKTNMALQEEVAADEATLPPTGAPSSSGSSTTPPPTTTPPPITAIPTAATTTIEVPDTTDRPTAQPVAQVDALNPTDCFEYMTTADENVNDVLLRGEYIVFINLVAGDETGETTFQKPFQTIPQSLQDNYFALETDESGIQIVGSKPGTVPLPEQEVALANICNTTETLVLLELGLSKSPDTPTESPDGDVPSVSPDAPSTISPDTPTVTPSFDSTNMTTTSSPAPSVVSNETSSSSSSPSPSESLPFFSTNAPSFQPSSMVPSSVGQASAQPSTVPSSTMAPSGNLSISSSSMAPSMVVNNTTSLGPTLVPTASFGLNGQFNITNTFFISNAAGYTAASLRSGKTRNQLLESFKRTVFQAVKEKDALGVSLRRYLKIVVQEGSVQFSNITDVTCTTTIDPSIGDDYLCQEVIGIYILNATNEMDTMNVEGDYADVVDSAIRDGLLQQELDALNVYSPITIETGEQNVDRTPPPPPPAIEVTGIGTDEESDWLTGVIIGGAIVFMMICTYFFLKWFDRYSADPSKNNGGEPSTAREFAKKRPKVKNKNNNKKEQAKQNVGFLGRGSNNSIT